MKPLTPEQFDVFLADLRERAGRGAWSSRILLGSRFKAVALLDSYDALRARVAELERERDEAKSEAAELLPAMDMASWLQAEYNIADAERTSLREALAERDRLLRQAREALATVVVNGGLASNLQWVMRKNVEVCEPTIAATAIAAIDAALGEGKPS